MGIRDLEAALGDLAAADLLRQRRTVHGPQGPKLILGGQTLLAFCSNDYLGLAADGRLVEAVQAAARLYGVGAGASHLISGHTDAHAALEAEMAAFTGAGGALLFTNGYLANLGVLSALADRSTEIFADRLNHASLNDGAVLSRARLIRYGHLDYALLESRLAASTAHSRIVVTDSVFSMDGDLAQLDLLLALCERYDAWLYVDDAHGFGVLGPQGQGAPAHFKLRSERLIHLATLGKAAGGLGAVVLAHEVVIRWLVQKARTYIYTTAMPALVAEANRVSLRIIRDADPQRHYLRGLVAHLRAGLSGGPHTLLDSATPIQPLAVGSAAKATALSAALYQRGIWVPAIRPPTVPQGSARLRISLTALHQFADVNRLISELTALES